MIGPVFVPYSGSSIGSYFDLWEDLLLVDINIRNNRKPTSQTDTSYVEEIKLSLNFNFSQISKNVQFNFLPHIVVGLLYFAVSTSVLVLDLNYNGELPVKDREYPAKHSKPCWYT